MSMHRNVRSIQGGLTRSLFRVRAFPLSIPMKQLRKLSFARKRSKESVETAQALKQAKSESSKATDGLPPKRVLSFARRPKAPAPGDPPATPGYPPIETGSGTPAIRTLSFGSRKVRAPDEGVEPPASAATVASPRVELRRLSSKESKAAASVDENADDLQRPGAVEAPEAPASAAPTPASAAPTPASSGKKLQPKLSFARGAKSPRADEEASRLRAVEAERDEAKAELLSVSYNAKLYKAEAEAIAAKLEAALAANASLEQQLEEARAQLTASREAAAAPREVPPINSTSSEAAPYVRSVAWPPSASASSRTSNSSEAAEAEAATADFGQDWLPEGRGGGGGARGSGGSGGARSRSPTDQLQFQPRRLGGKAPGGVATPGVVRPPLAADQAAAALALAPSAPPARYPGSDIGSGGGGGIRVGGGGGAASGMVMPPAATDVDEPSVDRARAASDREAVDSESAIKESTGKVKRLSQELAATLSPGLAGMGGTSPTSPRTSQFGDFSPRQLPSGIVRARASYATAKAAEVMQQAKLGPPTSPDATSPMDMGFTQMKQYLRTQGRIPQDEVNALDDLVMASR